MIQEGSSSGILVGTFLLSIVSFLLLALFLFLSVGITYGKLLHYKEIHQESRTFHWYRAIVRATLGPGKRAQWTWKTSPNSVYLPMFGPLFEDLRGPPKYMLSQISRGNPQKPPAGDRIMASDDETEDAEATCVQKLFGVLRIYYTFLESMKRFYLGFVAGAYSKNWASKTPIVVLLCIASFQLFFLVLKKPFIKKKVQLVEIISLSGEVGIFATCLVLSEKGFTIEGEMKVGIFMILLSFVAFLAQLSNGWYALYEQTKRLDPDGSFLLGLKMAAVGLLLLFLTRNTTKKLENRASFSKDRSGPGTDPSTSRSRWGGFWSCGEGGSRAGAPPVDFKLKPKDLYKDLKDMFASR
ncbi:unnamed protein product [Thlaspi arvense]|uniref:Uncharacterized protein n=1 Tax=Thlaspi arvense TaxID=13288 RepID=A0AAU9RRC3_THLAR|nr:unnamed protein product [Thlaspi arvense]